MIADAKPSIPIAEAAENLVSFSLDRSELNQILSQLPQGSNLNLTALEYEIGLLKILTVGWAIAFFSEPGLARDGLTDLFWNSIHRVSQGLSSVSSASMGRDFDYFDVLKQRLKAYLGELQKDTKASDPTALIGPKFAQLCGQKDNPIAILSGSKMFHLALNGVKTYLQNINLEDYRKQD
jgi:hypothetical protein